MFSSRTSWTRQSNALTRLLESKQQRGDPIVDLTLSNPTIARFDSSVEHILPPLLTQASLVYEPHPFGLPTARDAVAQFYRAQHISLNTRNIVLTASTSEAYSYLFHLLCNPGDSILVPAPGYPLFDFLADLHGIALQRYRLDYDGQWHIDFDSMQRSITHTTRGIVLLHPNNPTGSFIGAYERDRINELTGTFALPLIVDEVFHPYAFEVPPPSFADNSKILTFTLNGISKLFGLPQAKLAWLIINGPDDEVAEARHRLEIIADTFLSVNTPVQHALPHYFRFLQRRTEEIKARVKRNYESARQIVHGSSMTLLHCQGGWNAIIRMPAVATDEQWALRFLDEYSILVHPGTLYNFAQGSHLVIGLITPPDDFDRAVHTIRLAVGKEVD